MVQRFSETSELFFSELCKKKVIKWIQIVLANNSENNDNEMNWYLNRRIKIQFSEKMSKRIKSSTLLL